MNKIVKVMSAVIMMVLTMSGLYAQGLQTEISRAYSPNAADLGRYGQVPVNYFNGLASVTVPLTEVKGKGITVPIYLSYHAGGNRTDEHPGWVGLGWSLHAGGCINRIVNGMNDEMSALEAQESGISNSGTNPGNLYHASETQTRNWGYEHELVQLDTAPYYMDYEPDEFQVCLEGINASFYIVGNNEVKIVSQSDVDFKVEWCLKNMDGSTRHPVFSGEIGPANESVATRYTYFYRITLINKDGVRYTFGNDENAIEFSTVTYGGVLRSSANTWYLKTIETPYGETVTFSYEKDGTPIVKNDSRYNWSYTDMTIGAAHDGVDSEYALAPEVRRSLSFALIQPSYLTSITCKLSGDHATFARDLTNEAKYTFTEDEFVYRFWGNYSQRTILFSVQSSNDYYCQLSGISHGTKSIGFRYTDSPDCRLKLLGVEVSDPNGSGDSTLKYLMEYNNEVVFPGYHAKCNDIWGYYNGISHAVVPYCAMSSLRVPDADRMKLDILTRITYPTGGYTMFEYEPHTYSMRMEQFPFGVLQNESAEDGMAGGLRISRITDVPLVGEPVVRSFSYLGDDGRSSGILSGTPKYTSNGYARRVVKYEDTDKKGHWHVDSLTIAGTYLLQQENHINQLSTTNGNHVTYSKVTEHISGNGYTEYRYTNHEDSLSMDTRPTKMLENFSGSVLTAPFNSRSLFRGLLKSRAVFSENGSPVVSEQYEYHIDTSYVIRSAAVSTSCGGHVKRLSYVKIPRSHPYLLSSTERVYPSNGGTPVVTERSYMYDSIHRHLLMETRQVVGDSTMTEEITYRYPDQMSLDLNPVLAGMVTRYMISEPVQTTVRRNGKIVSSTVTTWKSTGEDNDMRYVPDAVYEASTGAGIDDSMTYLGTPDTFSTHFTSGKVTSFDLYDMWGNPTVITEPDGVQTAMAWEPGKNYPSLIVRDAGIAQGTRYRSCPTMQSESFPIYSGSTNTRTITFESLEYSTVSLEIHPADENTEWFINMMIDGIYSLSAGRVFPSSSSLSPYYGVAQRSEITVPPGRHTMTIQTSACSQDSYGYFCGVSLRYPDVAFEPENVPVPSILFNGFEDEDDSDEPGFNSGKSHSGRYTVSAPIDSGRNYFVDYMVWSDSIWTYRKLPYGGTMTINEAGPIDNVRVYPEGSDVMSYTWDNRGNVLSATDGRGITTSYVYDAMDRLQSVFDNNRDTLSMNIYTYANQDSSSVSVSDNRVVQKQYTSTGGETWRETSVNYDGLGRKIHTLLRGASPCIAKPDIIYMTEYDTSGRESRVWIPFNLSADRTELDTSSMMAMPDCDTCTCTTISDARPFTEKIYEASPLERITEAYGPGEEWYEAGRSIRTEFLNNYTGVGELLCRRYSATFGTAASPTLTIISSGYYPSSTLYVIRTTDEDERTTLEFKDMYGQTVLVRVKEVNDAGDAEYFDTHYVYDTAGRLIAVLPPILSASLDSDGTWYESNVSVAEYAYLYRYDNRGNVIARKLPGCGWDYYIYDKGGRLVLSQDPVQRESGKWSFSVMDRLGRPAVSGISSNTFSYFSEPLRNVFVYATMPKNPAYGGQNKGYAIAGVTLASPDILTVDYYDGYGFLGNGAFPSATSSSVKFDTAADSSYASRYTSSYSGLHTGSLEKVLDNTSSTQYLWMVYYYDDKGQLAQSRVSSHIGGVEKYWYGYDFTGNVLKRKHSFVPTSGPAVTETYTYTYDTWARPLDTKLVIGSADTLVIRSNTYDNIGRLKTTGRSGSASLTSTYDYNVRTWMTSIQGSLFNETLYYQNGATPQWSGNISSMEWKSGNEKSNRRYNYTYDAMSRLVSADYVEPSITGAFSETYSYDMNGNMTSLSRYGLSSSGTSRRNLLDLTLTNTGNRLTSIDTSAVGYDAKGRQTSYNYGGASTMSYNVIDLPLLFTKGTTIVEWKYSAGGVKLQKKTIGGIELIPRH